MASADLIQRLDSFFRGSGPVTWSRLGDELASNFSEVHSYLANSCESDDFLSKVADRSYWHTNGFAKLILHEAPNRDYRVRLHAWLENGTTNTTEANIHNHRWDFASLLITGAGMMVRDFEVDRRGQQYHAFTYTRDERGSSVLTPIEITQLRQTRFRVIRPGESYVCSTTDVHVTTPLPGARCFSLIVQGRPQVSAATVYSRSAQPRWMPEAANSVAEPTVRQLLDVVVREAGRPVPH